MVLKDILKIIILTACISFTTACSSDDDNDGSEQYVSENDWMLVGEWELKNNYDDDSPKVLTISFNQDGSGIFNNNKSRWYTHDNILYIKVDKGRTIQRNYRISGATLEIERLGTYVTQLPVTGAWYDADAMKHYEGNTFCYYFDQDGRGLKYNFDYIGLIAKSEFKWNRTRNGISIIYRNETQDKKCAVSDNTMNIEGEGTFTSTPLFYGQWKAVDCEKGLISEDDYNFSTLEVKSKNGKDYFICNYKHKDAEKFKDSVFEGTVDFVTSHQYFFNDQQLFIIKDITGETDTKVLDYRYFYYPDHMKVYLDLSNDMESKRFVRYELTD